MPTTIATRCSDDASGVIGAVRAIRAEAGGTILVAALKTELRRECFELMLNVNMANEEMISWITV